MKERPIKYDTNRLDDPEYYFFLKQETLYWCSDFLDKKWYRRAFGGKWYHIDVSNGKETYLPTDTWTKRLDVWDGNVKVLKEEEYPVNKVDNKFKLWVEVIKNFVKNVRRRL